MERKVNKDGKSGFNSTIYIIQSQLYNLYYTVATIQSIMYSWEYTI